MRGYVRAMEGYHGHRLICPHCSGRHVAGECHPGLRRRVNRLLARYRVRRWLGAPGGEPGGA